MDCPCPKRNTLAGLPKEAMLEILVRAPFKSVHRSKCVAKAWRDLIDDPLNRGRLPQTLQGFFSFSVSYPVGNLEHGFVKYSASPVPVDMDPCLSFPMKLLETARVRLVDSCNGLLLFKYMKSNPSDELGYIVCNPATKHWATVPVCACCLQSGFRSRHAIFASHTYLVFDPIVSSHFHLVQFWRRALSGRTYLSETYSSETGVWSHIHTDWNEQGQLEGWRRQVRLSYGLGQGTLVNGILHLRVSDKDWQQNQIVAVDVQGRTKGTIKMPAAAKGRRWNTTPCICQSQGRLHYINQDFDAHDTRQEESYELSIWELQDYDRQEWVLKDTVSFLKLFGRMEARMHDFVVIIHPDRNVVFFVERLKGLIAYDMDCKEVSGVAVSSEILGMRVVPYIPYFSGPLALTNKN